MARQPHTATYKGKWVKVKLKNGEVFYSQFVNPTAGKTVIFHDRRLPAGDIAAFIPWGNNSPSARRHQISMYDYYGTFADHHVLPDGRKAKGLYVHLKAATRDEAKKLMARTFGLSWARIADTEEEAGIAENGLKEIDYRQFIKL